MKISCFSANQPIPSDKHNLIMAKATGLMSSLSKLLCIKVCLFANRSSYNACIMVLPNPTFGLLCNFIVYLCKRCRINKKPAPCLKVARMMKIIRNTVVPPLPKLIWPRVCSDNQSKFHIPSRFKILLVNRTQILDKIL